MAISWCRSYPISLELSLSSGSCVKALSRQPSVTLNFIRIEPNHPKAPPSPGLISGFSGGKKNSGGKKKSQNKNFNDHITTI
jgi:hypothetical protein